MAFILISKENNKPMKLIGRQLESQKTIKTATIFHDDMAKLFQSEMSDTVDIRFIQSNSIQEILLKNNRGHMERNDLLKLEMDYVKYSKQ